jgi:peptidoglycan/xylan/chitin deacetylase (PgdA/CDA1 family)
MLKSVFQLLSPAAKKARLSVLIFHRVLPEADPLFPDEIHARRFDEICGWLKSWCNVLPLDEAASRLGRGDLPARAACITFDDGYADNLHVALPILQRHRLTSTFFIATGFLDGGRMWNDTIIESVRNAAGSALDLSPLGLGTHALGGIPERRAAIGAIIGQVKYQTVADRIRITEDIAARCGVKPPDDLMMTSDEVRAMRRAGMQIGAHTVSHPILARLTDEDARSEVERSRSTLQQLLGEPVRLFAYPNGKPGEDYSERTVALVRDMGFDAAVSTRWGASGYSDDMFQIRRFTPWDRHQIRFGARLALNLYRH